MGGIRPTEFREAFERNRDGLFRFLFRLTRNAADAEDLLQETFLAVWRKQDRFEGNGSLAGYLRRTAYHLYCNHHRKADRRRRLAPVERTVDPAAGFDPPAPRSGPPLEDREAVSWLLSRVREEIEDLPPPQRDAFVLFRYEGMTCAAIAEATGVPVKTAESRVRLATRTLAGRLARYRHILPGGNA